MKRSFLFIFIVILMLSACSSQKNETALVLDLESKVDALVNKYMDLDIYSGVVLIAEKGNLVYHKAFGLADRDNNIPNTLNTRFDIGSMNKSFTKIAVLQLVKEGKININDKLGKYIDGFPEEAAGKITVDHLLNHQSGLGGYHTPEYWELPAGEKNMRTALEFIKKSPLFFEPGTETEYSNAGYVLLGVIIEKVTGKSFNDVIEERIVNKLGMENTFLRDKQSVPMRAIGYFKNFKGELQSNEAFIETPKPDGGFYSTASDMMNFYREYHYGEKLWDDSMRKLDRNYDFYKKQLTTGGAISHAGGFEGANTVHFEILRDRISVVVFANMDEIVAENLGEGILSIIRGKEPKEPQLPAEQLVYEKYEENGIGFIKDNWEELTVNFHPADPEDMILNQIGYEFLFDGDLESALEIFKLNTELYPDVANCWDSYGEALLENGQTELSLEAYKKALSIDPYIGSAKQKIKEITGS